LFRIGDRERFACPRSEPTDDEPSSSLRARSSRAAIEIGANLPYAVVVPAFAFPPLTLEPPPPPAARCHTGCCGAAGTATPAGGGGADEASLALSSILLPVVVVLDARARPH